MTETLTERDAFIKSLLKYIGDNAKRESRFSSPNPQYNINVQSLVEKIEELSGLPAKTISTWIDGEG